MVANGRGKGRPKLTEAAEIDRAIREAALQVLLEHGEAATMNAVAVAAGISRKSLYARHPNKTELFLEAIRELLKPAGALHYDASGTAEARLQRYIEAALEVVSRPQSLTIQRLLTIDPAYISALKADMFGAMRRIFFEPLLALLREAQTNKELLIDDLEQTTRSVIRLILAESMPTGDSSESPMSAERQANYAAFLTNLVTRGLLPR